MTWFDYSLEPKSDIAFIDMKSFYASVECVDRGLHPLKTSLCVMSRADNSAGLILASSPMFKKVFEHNFLKTLLKFLLSVKILSKTNKHICRQKVY